MDIQILALHALPVATAVVCWLAPRRGLAELFSALGAGLTLAVGLLVAIGVFASGPASALGGTLYVDALSAYLLGVIVVVGFAAALYSIPYLRHDLATGEVPEGMLRWYYCGYHAFVWTMIATCTVDNLGLLWVAVEATTLASALLVGFYRTKAALEAAWKYLILCSVGITFALFGVLLTYYASVQALGPEASDLSWRALHAAAGRLDPSLMRLAFVFILIGFGTKAGFAPLHTWLPDAHSQAPSPVSAVLSGVLLNCALYAILRFHLITAGAVGAEFSSGLLLAFGLLSVAVAVPFIVVQRDLKRLLAYSSVEHVGLIAVAVGLGGPLGLYAGLLHLFNHAVTKSLLFFVAGELTQRYGTRRLLAIRGALTAMPVTGTLLLVGAFAITGAPPFGIFVSELGIVTAGFAAGRYTASVALVALLALVFAGFIAHVVGLAFGRPGGGVGDRVLGGRGDGSAHQHPTPNTQHLSFVRSLAFGIPALFVVLFGVHVPVEVSRWIEAAALVLQRGGL